MYWQIAGSIGPAGAGGRGRILTVGHVATLAGLAARAGIGALFPLAVGALDWKRDRGIRAIGQDQGFQRAAIAVRRGHVVARAAQRTVLVVRRLRPLVRWGEAAGIVVRATTTGRAFVAVALGVVQPDIGVADHARLSERPAGHHAMASMTGNPAVVVGVIGRIQGTFEQTAVGTLDRIIRRAKCGFDHAAAIPALRGVATQAKIPGTREILVGDIDRRPEQRVTRGVGHHRSTPGAVRAEFRIVAGKPTVAATARIRGVQRKHQARLGTMRGEIQREHVAAGQQQNQRQNRAPQPIRLQSPSMEFETQVAHLTQLEGTHDGVMLVRSLARTRLPWVIGCRKARTPPEPVRRKRQHSGRLKTAGRQTG